jgi:hypothetical protein
VVAPLKVSHRQIHKFVSLKQDWVVNAFKKVKIKAKTVKKWGVDEYKEGVLIPFQGQQLLISLQVSGLKKVKIELFEQKLMVFLPNQIIQHDKNEFIRCALINWMKKQAKSMVSDYVDLHAERFNLYPRFIKIKTQKSRWGSCGIHNDININWLLILAPSEVLEYVVVHEICHIKERNHSASFWALVEKHLPEYKKQRQWLKQNGNSLMQGL